MANPPTVVRRSAKLVAMLSEERAAKALEAKLFDKERAEAKERNRAFYEKASTDGMTFDKTLLVKPDVMRPKRRLG